MRKTVDEAREELERSYRIMMKNEEGDWYTGMNWNTLFN